MKSFFSRLLLLLLLAFTTHFRVSASSFLRFWDHTQWHNTVGRTPLDEWSARRRDLYLTTHNTHNRQTPTSPAEFEPAIPAGERLQTHALDRSDIEIGFTKLISVQKHHMPISCNKCKIYKQKYVYARWIKNGCNCGDFCRIHNQNIFVVIFCTEFYCDSEDEGTNYGQNFIYALKYCTTFAAPAFTNT
jgi:hypothetical protein